MLTRESFMQVFSLGETIKSGAGDRKNAADLEILGFADDSIQHKSAKSGAMQSTRYDYISLLVDHFEELDPKSIQNSVNKVLREAGLDQDFRTETYAYTLAKEFHKRTGEMLFLASGEELVTGETEAQEQEYREGRRTLISIERIERDDKARRECIRQHGATCFACGFNFEVSYGELGSGYIHVHHQGTPLAATDGDHKVDPLIDLIPLCPNCHAMVHIKKPMLSVAKLKEILEQRKL
jgi:predicted HNH restriction endonuclease